MLYSAFPTLQAAREWRADHGGWLFVPDKADFVLWFNLKFTAGAVMRHHATKGLNGLLA